MNWKKIKQQVVYTGYRNVVRKTFLMPNGSQDDFDTIDQASYVSIGAMTKDQQIILIKQFRPGPEIIVTSFPEGQINPNENPTEAAKRELLEETGYQAGEMIFLKEKPEAYTNTKKLCFIATNCQKIAQPTLDPNEHIEVFTLSVEAFKTLIRDPKDHTLDCMDNGYLMLDYLKLL